MTTVNKRNIA